MHVDVIINKPRDSKNNPFQPISIKDQKSTSSQLKEQMKLFTKTLVNHKRQRKIATSLMTPITRNLPTYQRNRLVIYSFLPHTRTPTETHSFVNKPHDMILAHKLHYYHLWKIPRALIQHFLSTKIFLVATIFLFTYTCNQRTFLYSLNIDQLSLG